MISKTKINKSALRKTNPELKQTILLLKKQKNPAWIQIAKYLSRPRRKAIQVNLDKINKYGKNTVIVPGKILGKGELNKKIIISSFAISSQAKEKIKASGSSYIKISELIKKNPDVKDIKVIL